LPKRAQRRAATSSDDTTADTAAPPCAATPQTAPEPSQSIDADDDVDAGACRAVTKTPAHPKDAMSMLTILMLVLLVAALGGGGFGYSRWGYMGWSPAALIFIVFIVLSFTGVLRWR
jgi:hypothetical protein